MRTFVQRDVRVVLLSVTVTASLGTLFALGLAVLMGGAPPHWDLPELVRQVPLALLFGLLTSAPFAVPLGFLGGCIAAVALRRGKRLPREQWMMRGCVVGAAVGFLPLAIWGMLFGPLNEVLLLPLLCGVGGALSGAIVGTVLSRFEWALSR